MKILDIARICHEANRAYCIALGDNSQPFWYAAPDWQKESAISGVRNIINGTIKGPEDSHKSWYASKYKDGWRYGPVKDPDKKLHPCMVSFNELPVDQQTKDYLFWNIVTALRSMVEIC